MLHLSIVNSIEDTLPMINFRKKIAFLQDNTCVEKTHMLYVGKDQLPDVFAANFISFRDRCLARYALKTVLLHAVPAFLGGDHLLHRNEDLAARRGESNDGAHILCHDVLLVLTIAEKEPRRL